MKNKLFATFVPLNNLPELILNIQNNFIVKYNKIFVLNSTDTNEYVCTYNVEGGNVKNVIVNTILVHRKKETNTLYTINALNEVIKYHNNGKLDSSFQVNWENYRNCIILTDGGTFKKLNTKIYKIIEV